MSGPWGPVIWAVKLCTVWEGSPSRSLWGLVQEGPHVDAPPGHSGFSWHLSGPLHFSVCCLKQALDMHRVCWTELGMMQGAGPLLYMWPLCPAHVHKPWLGGGVLEG